MAKKKRKLPRPRRRKKTTAKSRPRVVRKGKAISRRHKKPRVKSKPHVVGKGKTIKTLAELSLIKRSFAAEIGETVSIGACWFKDPSGRDYCVPSASADSCKNAGGQWDPAPCPND